MYNTQLSKPSKNYQTAQSECERCKKFPELFAAFKTGNKISLFYTFSLHEK